MSSLILLHLPRRAAFGRVAQVAVKNQPRNFPGTACEIQGKFSTADCSQVQEKTQDIFRLNKPAAVLPRIAVFSAVEQGAWRIMSKDSIIFAALLHSSG